MAYKFPRLSPTLRTKLQAIPAAARAHRFWFVTGTVTLLLMTASFIFGYTSLRRLHALEQQEQKLENVLSRVDGWVAGFRATTPAESLVWKNSERVLEELQEGAAAPAAIAAVLTQRAARLGIEPVYVRLYQDSAFVAPEPKQLAGWSLEAQVPTLQVEFESSFDRAIGFVEALPPHVEVRDVAVERNGDRVRARFTLLAYRATRS